jgi:VWFA-related protein
MLQSKSVRLKFVVLLLFASAASVVAQQAGDSQPASSGVTLKVNARITLVDVTVTDSKGKPVHGLTQADFTVKEDGKPQPLKSFQEYGAAIPPAQPAPAPLPPNVYSNAQPPPPTSGAVDILMFDNLSTGLARGLKEAPDQVMYEKAQALRYLNSMPAGTQVAIVELADGVRVVQSFTSDRDLLLAAIHTLVYQPVQGAVDPMNLEHACIIANRQSELVLNGLARAAAFLAGVKGRKNLIWFTPGTPWLTNYKRFSRVRCLRDFTSRLTGVYGELTAAQVALYPVDPRGVEDCLHSVGTTPADTNASGPPSPTGLANLGCVNVLPDEHQSLDDMARATGGEAYYNRNDVDGAIHDAIATGTDYYALSYAPPDPKYDERYHTINVKVDRPGLRLVYRDSYTSLDPATMAAMAEPAKKAHVNAGPNLGAFEMALGHGASPSTQLLFNVRVTAAAKAAGLPAIGSLSPALKGKPLVRYDFGFSLPSDQITLATASDGARKGSLDLAIAVYDGDGRMLNFVSQTGVVAVKPERMAQFLQKPFQIPLQLDLPPGKIFVRVGVRDVVSEKIGTFEIPVTVAK